MSILKRLFAILCAAIIFTSVFACEQEGPAERTGEAVDETMEDAGEATRPER